MINVYEYDKELGWTSAAIPVATLTEAKELSISIARKYCKEEPAFTGNICIGASNKGAIIIPEWMAFYNKESGKKYCAVTWLEAFPGEEEATTQLLAADHGIDPTQIEVRFE
ncbi:hypothetical protein SAMN04487897_109153 [Paenibacillus sp. yr247]|uniref:hypothetical protein n=1 Tax=Paenibacillus sp. yr247 TaxID=1761880 RepID=UPI0008922BDD|nr:hypothetical protein [Paenibacillus sp. yr247]SDO18919.1 hypothetical protein SAMN04487897_109153 [Paenibacillus sp. yr247]